jgi:hypothetical protein
MSALVPEKVTSYSWEQTDEWVKVRVEHMGAAALGLAEQGAEAAAPGVRCEFTETSVRLSIVGDDGAAKEFAVHALDSAIDAAASKCVLKDKRVLIKMKKAEAAAEWMGLDDALRKKEEARKARVETGELKGADTQALLADMYANADDETRKSLRDSARTGQMKREEQAEARGSN